MATSVCGKKQYETWKAPCGMTIIPGEYGIKQDILAFQIKDKIDHIISKLYEAKHMSIYRIQNIENVQAIEALTEFLYEYGAKDMKAEQNKVRNSNATYIVLDDYDSMASAVMFTEQILFHEKSSEFHGQLNKVSEYKLLSENLANILCDFVLIQAKSGIMPITYLTCKNTVPERMQSRGNDNEWMFIEYLVLRDIKLYLEVMIPKYQLLRSILRRSW
ncbi:hypothetical protein CHS0354_041133 [Potamilus streckersoni]|uniref:Uncharacterized protein n=1 Tax=Potamilus streckersoni TaxID=2493646 RepID=A0AAE0SEA0_9BIVA|nr:hypothetical protein CHS0354_041133 [Potamilus streckersoni]